MGEGEKPVVEFFVPESEMEAIREERRKKKVVAPPKGRTLVRRMPKIGRNAPCPCGSGKKFKKCHLSNMGVSV